MSQFVPVRSVVGRLEELGLQWPEVIRDLKQASVTPACGYDTRLRYVGAEVEAFVEPGHFDGEEALWIIGLRRRVTGDPLPREQQVVGRDYKRGVARRRGGSGQRWPTTWAELIARIEAHPDTELRRGGKHLNVLYRGKQVQTLPLTASDRRALLNACQVLRGCGIDVRRGGA